MSRETRRLRLHADFLAIAGNAYFQPPASISMRYPCIVYHYRGDSVLHADNKLYKMIDEYEATLITKDPMPDEMMDAIINLPYARYDRHYIGDNLHHYLFTIKVIERNTNG